MSTITDTSLLELLSGLTGRNIPQRNSFDNFIFGLPDVDAGSPSCKPSVRNNIIQIENSINQIYSKYSNALTWNQGGIVTRPDLWDEIKLLLEKLPNDHAATHALLAQIQSCVDLHLDPRVTLFAQRTLGAESESWPALARDSYTIWLLQVAESFYADLMNKVHFNAAASHSTSATYRARRRDDWRGSPSPEELEVQEVVNRANAYNMGLTMDEFNKHWETDRRDAQAQIARRDGPKSSLFKPAFGRGGKRKSKSKKRRVRKTLRQRRSRRQTRNIRRRKHIPYRKIRSRKTKN